MEKIRNIQVEFFKTLSSIQEVAVYTALSEYKEGDSLEDLLFNATYEAICDILVLIDGYKNDKLKLDLIDSISKVSLKTGIQMHDMCADYLKYEK